MTFGSFEEEKIIESVGLKLTQRGRYLEVDTNRTQEEHIKILKSAKKSIENILPKIEDDGKWVFEQLQKFNSFDIISQISIENLSVQVDEYKEHEHKGNSAFIEYATLLCLKGPYVKEPRLQFTPDDLEILKQVQHKIHEIFNNSMNFLMFKDIDENDPTPPSELERFCLMMQLRDLSVRNPAYSHHLQQVLSGLYKPFDPYLDKTLGFKSSDSITLLDDIPNLVNEKFYGEQIKIRKIYDQLFNEIDYYKRKKKPKKNSLLNNELLEKISLLNNKNLNLWLMNFTLVNFSSSPSELLTFSADELSIFSQIEVPKVNSFLEKFSLHFDQPDIIEGYSPAFTHKLKNKPLVTNDNLYICPSPSLLDWAIQPNFEDIIKDSSIAQNYYKHRHDFVLDYSIELFKKLIPNAIFEKNLFYKMEIDNELREFECDILIMYKSCLFLIEVKGEGMSEASYRGASKSLEKDLKSILKFAYSQAIRTKKYLNDVNPSVFRREDKTKFNIDKNNFTRVFLMTISLEPLGLITATMNSKHSLKFFDKDEFPWMVNLYDLIVLADHIGTPEMLINYLQSRKNNALEGIVTAYDELTLLSCYLQEGLFIEQAKEHDFFQFDTTWTTKFDDYYFYKTGKRKKIAKKLQQEIPPKFNELLNALDKQGSSVAFDVSVELLNIPIKERFEFTKKILKCKKSVKNSSQIYYFDYYIATFEEIKFVYICGKSIDAIRKKANTFLKSVNFASEKFSKWICIGDDGKNTFNPEVTFIKTKK